MHAVSIEAGGIVPLPRIGGALLHAVGSIRNLPRHCQTGEKGSRRKEKTAAPKYSLGRQQERQKKTGLLN
jgi:hypothetical protein